VIFALCAMVISAPFFVFGAEVGDTLMHCPKGSSGSSKSLGVSQLKGVLGANEEEANSLDHKVEVQKDGCAKVTVVGKRPKGQYGTVTFCTPEKICYTISKRDKAWQGVVKNADEKASYSRGANGYADDLLQYSAKSIQSGSWQPLSGGTNDILNAAFSEGSEGAKIQAALGQSSSETLGAIASGNFGQVQEISNKYSPTIGAAVSDPSKFVETLPQKDQEAIKKSAETGCDGSCLSPRGENGTFVGGSENGGISSDRDRENRFGRLVADRVQYLDSVNDQYGLPEDYMTNVAYGESRLCTNVKSKISSASGCYQYIESTWVNPRDPNSGEFIDWAKANNRADLLNLSRNQQLQLRFDTEISAQVTAHTAARRMNDYGSLIQSAVNTGVVDHKTALYSFHLLGEDGGKNALTALVRDPNAHVTSYVDSASIQGNRRLLNGSVVHSFQNLNSFMNNQGSVTSSFGANTLKPPFTSPLLLSGSGFGNPLSNFLGYGTTDPSQLINQQIQAALQKVSSGDSSSGGSSSTTKTPTTVTTTFTPEVIVPNITLIAQPSEVPKGDSLNLIWSAVGVSTSRECRLFDEQKDPRLLIAEANSGSIVVAVPAVTTETEMSFTLACIPRDARATSTDAVKKIIIPITN